MSDIDTTNQGRRFYALRTQIWEMDKYGTEPDPRMDHKINISWGLAQLIAGLLTEYYEQPTREREQEIRRKEEEVRKGGHDESKAT